MDTKNIFSCVFLAAALVAAGAACADRAPAQRMDRARLLIGAYCLQANARTAAHVKAIKDCGVDFIIGIPASDRATLDLFAQYGVGAIVGGVVPGWWGGNGERAGQLRTVNPPEKYAAGAATFKDHPAIWAVDIGDEPSALDFPYYGDVVRQLNRLLPGMPLYLNLYPNYASVAQNTGRQTVNQLGTRTYAEHIAAYCRNVPLDYISYDFYPYTGAKRGDLFLSKCYDDFLVVAKACRETKRSFWYIPQVNSHVGQPPTSERRLRFQAYAAMSFGAEAITWACWSKGWWENNILDEKGNATGQYAKLRKINAELKRVGPAYMKYRSVATTFVGYPETSPRNPTQPFSRVSRLDAAGVRGLHAGTNAPLLVGEMVARTPGSAKRALFVTAAWDPRDEQAPSVEKIFLKAKAVKALGGEGPIPLTRMEKGFWSFPLASSAGALVEVE